MFLKDHAHKAGLFLQLALSGFYDNPTAGESPEINGRSLSKVCFYKSKINYHFLLDMDIDLHPDPLVMTDSTQPSNIRSGAISKPNTKPKSSRFGSIRDLGNNDDQNSEEEGQRSNFFSLINLS